MEGYLIMVIGVIILVTLLIKRPRARGIIFLIAPFVIAPVALFLFELPFSMGGIYVLWMLVVFVLFAIIEFHNEKLYRKAKEDGYKTDASKSDFRWARIHAFFWLIGFFFVSLAVSMYLSGMDFLASLIIGWLICGASAIVRALKSPDSRQNRAKHRARMRGTTLGVRLFCGILFWLGELFWPVLFAPIINLVRIFRYIKSGSENREGLSEKESEIIQNESPHQTESFGDRVADAIIDMTSNETTGVKPEWKGEVKINEFNETIYREEGSSDWHKGTEEGSDFVEINGERYYKRN